VEKILKAEQVKYPEWLLATADAEKFNTPDLSVYANQADFYRKLSWVLAAVTHVATEAALVDFNVERAEGEDSAEIPNHPFELLLRKPNPLDSRYEFLYSTVAMKKLTGNAYWWLNRSNENAEPDEMWLIPSHMIKPVPDGKMYLKGYIYYPGGMQKEIALEPWEVCHFRSFNPFNRFLGLSAMESLAVASVGDLGMQTWNTKFFAENNARLPGILAFADYIDNDQWLKIKEDTREASRKRDLMMLRGVGQGGLNWLQNAVSQKDMEFLSGRKANRDEIWTVLAPGLASMLDTNAIAGRATFRERAVYPELVTMGEKISGTILPSYGDNLYGEFEDIRYVDRQLELQEQETFAKSHTVEEIRKEYYNEKPLGDERDKLFVTQITADTGKVVEPETVTEPPVFDEEAVTETIPPVEQNALSPDDIKAIVELDKWDAKSNKAGKLTVWHNIAIPCDIYKAVKDKTMTFDEARGAIKRVSPVPEASEQVVIVDPTPIKTPDYSFLLEAMRLEVQMIKSAPVDPQPINITLHNHPSDPNPIIVESPTSIVNVPDQPAPVVNVKTEQAPVNNPPDESADVVKAIRSLAKKSKKK
jgi:HK97 family phage portal protein